MLLSSDRGADSGGPARDKQGTGCSGNPGTKAPGLGGLRGGGANPPSGQDMTTRSPAMRRQFACPKAVSLPSSGCSTRVA